MFTAHIRESDNKEQSVSEHGLEVSALTGEYLKSISLSEVGRLIGLLHDAGKLRKLFDDYINGRNNMRRGSIDHSYAGAKYLKELAKDKDAEIKIATEGISHTIISHHGINDWLDEDGNDEFLRRTSKNDDYEEISANISKLSSKDKICEMHSKAADEWLKAVRKLLCKGKKVESAFYVGMLERLIQSALIDADRTNTADFMSGQTTKPEADNSKLWEQMNKRMNEKLASFSKLTDKISLRRKSISDRCAAFADHRVSACRLIVPTGGGKTLSSLRFAIKQCKKFRLKRIFYIAPFMSILEQNSEIIGFIAGEENFLEHHSNIISEIDDENELEQYKQNTERWDKPVIATTMVQFLNTLFSSKTASVRRMHRLSDAVIIIDEVQSVPIRCIDIFNLAINFLTKQCNSTVVLCSATQPPFDEKLSFPLILDKEKDMVGDCQRDFEVFKRTQIIPVFKRYGYELEEATNFCYEKFIHNGNLLIVVNTKAQARELYCKLKEQLEEKDSIIHLSTNMCPCHRKEKIDELKEKLRNRKPVICVTTQLIEAGVDISFGCVVRAVAGLDNAAQAAGRCNRSGEYDHICPVYLINFKSENLRNLDIIKSSQIISRNIIDNTDEDLLSAEVQRRYFAMLFERYKNELSYNVKDSSTKSSILNLLSTNHDRWSIKQKTYKLTSQAFKTAGDLFEVIDSKTKSVIVPHNEDARNIIAELESDISPQRKSELLRRAQKYIVSIYANTECILKEKGALNLNILDERFYSKEFGVTIEGSELEVLIY